MKKNLAPLMSSKKMDWETPDELFQRYNKIHNFTVDLAASAENTKCKHFYSIEDDSLSKDWVGVRGWLNPPYGRDIGKWFKKAHYAAIVGEMMERPTTIVMLVPSRTDTSYWQDHVIQAELEGSATIESLRGRVKFKGASASAPFPSAVITYCSGRA